MGNEATATPALERRLSWERRLGRIGEYLAALLAKRRREPEPERPPASSKEGQP